MSTRASSGPEKLPDLDKAFGCCIAFCAALVSTAECLRGDVLDRVGLVVFTVLSLRMETGSRGPWNSVLFDLDMLDVLAMTSVVTCAVALSTDISACRFCGMFWVLPRLHLALPRQEHGKRGVSCLPDVVYRS